MHLDHDHIGAHSHEEAHTHEHTHADGTTHTHEHAHPHDHTHDCGHGCESCGTPCEHTPMYFIRAHRSDEVHGWPQRRPCQGAG